MSYVKLFGSILDSTIWLEPLEVRVVWITMLAMADQFGEVHASVPGLARRAGVSLGDAKKALDAFLSPDEHSRSKEFEGRRIEPIDGGWRLLNHGKYREKMSLEERRQRDAARKRAARASEKSGRLRTRPRTSENVRKVSHTDQIRPDQNNTPPNPPVGGVGASGAHNQTVRDAWAQAFEAERAGAPPHLAGQTFVAAVEFARAVARTHGKSLHEAALGIGRAAARLPQERRKWALAELDPYATSEAAEAFPDHLRVGGRRS